MNAKKNILSVILFFFSLASFSQTASIYGIPFGSSFTYVEKVLDQKLLQGKYINYDQSILEYHDVNLAGIIFGSLIIEFNNVGYDNIMSKAQFVSCYKSNITQLKKDRDELFKKLSQKYSFVQPYINPIGFKSYKFGFNKSAIVGNLSVSILEKEQSSFGIDYYYLDLRYSPNFSDSSDL